MQKCICKCTDDAQCGAREFFLYFCARFFNLFLVCRLTLFSRLFSIVCKIVFEKRIELFRFIILFECECVFKIVCHVKNWDFCSILRVKRLAKCSSVVGEAVAFDRLLRLKLCRSNCLLLIHERNL